ncbi:MAG: histidine phosphatase family protein [Candidatus Aenigmarchaeota archaeon]|nr:histidine phosphatase family protein [Candidatus Aenigmarchaeota archaeon]
MKIFLIRHGETVENAQHIVQGQAYGRLSPKGMEQAKKVASRLAKEHIDAVISSPLERADLTAREIARQHGLKIIYDDRISERKFGSLEGITRDEYFDMMEKSGLPKHEFRPSGGESYIDMKERIGSFYRMLLEKYAGKTVVVVAHGSLNRVFLSVVNHVPLEKAHDVQQENACVNIIEIAGGKPVVRLVNCTEHLGEEAASKGRF